jgi:hypothetical protein
MVGQAVSLLLQPRAHQQMAELDFVSGDLNHLRRLAALDRYEGRALARGYDASLQVSH